MRVSEDAPLLSVIIPIYNERETIEAIVDLVRSVAIQKEIILVDDGPQDGTAEIIAAAAGRLTVIQDADLEHNPKDYALRVPLFDKPGTRVVYGSRFLSGKQVTHPLHLLVNQIITWVDGFKALWTLLRMRFDGSS